MKQTREQAKTVPMLDNPDPERVWAAIYAGRQMTIDVRSLIRGVIFSSVFLIQAYQSRHLAPATINAYETWLYTPSGGRLVGLPIAAYRAGYQFAQRVSTTLLTAIPVGHAKMTLNQYRLADKPHGRSLAGLEQWLLNGAYTTLLTVLIEEIPRIPEQLDCETALWLPQLKP
jgi:hypothetical protein